MKAHHLIFSKAYLSHFHDSPLLLYRFGNLISMTRTTDKFVLRLPVHYNFFFLVNTTRENGRVKSLLIIITGK